MEEILQSIKRIIAEENTEDAEAKEGAKPVANNNAPKAPPSDDVLELTDLADDDAEELPEIVAAKEIPAPKPAAPMSALTPHASSDSILEAVDRMPAKEPHKDVLDDIDSLLSSEAAKASAKALQSLHATPKQPAQSAPPSSPGIPFRSGHTVEDLALEALRPMLKQWLDANLPGIVERLVEREVKKLSSF